MQKQLIICGPTATGKTGLGIKLAKKLSGEIISADSRQVYKYMDIGTGKDLGKFSNFPHFVPLGGTSRDKQISSKEFTIGYYLIEGIPVWLYDLVEPDYRFNVADYINCAHEVIENIWKRDKLPIVIGGTGFYIKGLIDGIDTIGIKPDWELRKQLSNYPIIQLSNCLKKLDLDRWKKTNESDRKNPRRLIRAIEIARTKVKITYKDLKMDVLLIGLMAPYKFLYQRIDKRVTERIEKGVEKEIGDLLKKGYNWQNSIMGATMGYREWQAYFEGKDSKDNIIQRWKFAEHNYARRQMTWFRKALRQAQGYWFDISRKTWQAEVENLVGTWYTQF